MELNQGRVNWLDGTSDIEGRVLFP